MVIDNFIKELEDNKEIKNFSIENYTPIGEMTKEILLEDISYLSSESDLKFFKNTNGLKIDWGKDSENIFEAGECNILGGLDVFFSSGKNIYWDDDNSDENEFDKFCQRLILFDKYDKAYDSTRNIAIEINEEKSKIEKLWYWNDEGDKYPLSLDLSNYFLNLMKTKAIINWQLFFIDFKSVEFKDEIYRESLYGTTQENTLEEMGVALRTSKIFNKELSSFLEKKYKQTAKEFKKF
jgi:hypothetical protein